MGRSLWVLALCLLAGCGEPERPHFVPASRSGPGARPADRPAAGKPSREVAAPTKIEMH